MWIWRNLVVLSSIFIITYGINTDQVMNEKYEILDSRLLTRVISCKNTQDMFKASEESSAMITYINSSSGLNSVIVRIDGCSVGRICSESKLWSRDCMMEVVSRNSVSGFECSGEIVMERFGIKSGYDMKSIVIGGNMRNSMKEERREWRRGVEIMKSEILDIYVN